MIHETLNYKVTAIHYPKLSEYFSCPVAIEDTGNEYRISTYWIEKKEILLATKTDKVINLELNNGITVRLDIF